MKRRNYSKNNKNGLILVRNKMRKFVKMKTNTEMSLTNLVLNANILIEFSFLFNFVYVFSRNSLKMITCLIILYRLLSWQRTER